MTSKQAVVALEPALRYKNAAASVTAVWLFCTIYLVLPYTQPALHELFGPPQFAFTGLRFMLVAASVYSLTLVAYFLRDTDPRLSKSLRFFRVVGTYITNPIGSFKAGLAREDRLAVLSTLLKGFFGPMMTKSLMAFCMGVWTNGAAMLDVGLGEGMLVLFDSYGFWFLWQAILFVDVFFFTVGYLIESRRLGNEIRSVDPTLVGWAAALICYPPFNSVTGKLLGAQVSQFPQFDDPTVHLTMNVLLLALMAAYASASAALGLKASNLTHRGIVARGPYAVIRHPAYVCKNLAWWIGAVPMVVQAFDRSLIVGLQSAGSVAAWSAVYLLRALTEEDHLRRVDGDYATYAAKVRYRFIPGIL